VSIENAARLKAGEYNIWQPLGSVQGAWVLQSENCPSMLLCRAANRGQSTICKMKRIVKTLWKTRVKGASLWFRTLHPESGAQSRASHEPAVFPQQRHQFTSCDQDVMIAFASSLLSFDELLI
jgi:hypothetical protein